MMASHPHRCPRIGVRVTIALVGLAHALIMGGVIVMVSH